ncbi:ESX-1 secretion-associated regulator EspR [Mycobacteroides abscessus subsp. massiliense]|nr:helix-turn-helix transcriptional regulator [Mycobacteroides abscessus]SKE06668.1 ESX-1 secretion-associated regulator EspR [Mycobacteroides abscessus subsp. massiliense]SKE52525.1 ESX-1 secretion-associated regulator EspR [Mycobacteroides abscessus subsp. massiliense]SKE81074.1 ESX-1 secretion-associated regulator EspR [Mycobacteroides abscessus subsp. massiliense]SKE88351.1 ESX-1 secretion-associated regulator EspR [Mycobacteroides abscessus subsp. massiliense]SKE92729.1 ESX-1 secretion-as
MAQFSQRLAHLMQTVYPAGRGPYTLGEVVAGIADHGAIISVPYLSHLRNGTRTNPKPEIVTALAAFFKVSPAYFYDDDYAQKVDEDLSLLVRLRDAKVREIAERSHALSATSRQVVADMVNHLRKVEGIPEAGDTPA